MKGLPEGFTARPIALEDAELVTDIMRTYTREITGEHVGSLERTQIFLGIPGLNLADSTRIVLDAHGEPCALLAA